MKNRPLMLVWLQLRFKHIQINIFACAPAHDAAVVGGAMIAGLFAYDEYSQIYK